MVYIQYEIYREQLKYHVDKYPFNYMPFDIIYRLPIEAGPREPPIRYIYPVKYRTRRGKEVPDPLTVYMGRLPSELPFAINPRNIVNPLVFIVGTPGAGKSATIKTFIFNLLNNEAYGKIPPIIVVDPEGEYHIVGKLVDPNSTLHLQLGRRDYINLFDRPTKTINPFAWYMRMLAVIQKFLHLSEAQAGQAYRVLKKAIFKVAEDRGITHDPATWYKEDITLRDIYNYIDNLIRTIESKQSTTATEKREHRGAVTLYSRLDSWMYPPNDAFSNPSTVDLAKVFKYKLIVLDARGLSKDLFGVFTYWIVYWFYGLLLEQGPLPEFGIRFVLIIDEAWALLKKDERKQEENPLEALARRGRKYGIWIWVATQTPEDVDEKMFSLFGTLATGTIPSAKMVTKIVKSRGMPRRFATVIKSLPRGTLVWSINWANKDFPMSQVPLIVSIDYPIKGLISVA